MKYDQWKTAFLIAANIVDITLDNLFSFMFVLHQLNIP